MEELDFVKSDHCTECEGKGFLRVATKDNLFGTYEQCESCEELHWAELRADRMQDEMKGC